MRIRLDIPDGTGYFVVESTDPEGESVVGKIVQGCYTWELWMIESVEGGVGKCRKLERTSLRFVTILPTVRQSSGGSGRSGGAH